jgi:hypothetical protein
VESSYFELYSDPKLEKAEIRNHEIWANCGVEYTDILRKTIISLQVLENMLEDFDFIVRTNVSSYFDHSKIEEVLLKYQDLNYFYGGYVMESKSKSGNKIPFVSGAAVFWNSKTAKIVSQLNPDDFNDYPDDVAFSMFMAQHHVKTTFLSRGNICSHGFFTIASHYRLKSSIHSELASIRILNYHKFTLEKNILRKTKILLEHQRLEFSYFIKNEISAYLVNCLQVVKIFSKYGIRK